MTIRDVEVIELLADEPELLAIADAVSATQKAAARPRRRRIAVRAGIVGAVAAAAIVAILAWPQGRPGGVIGRALAAIGDGRIMHVVTESPSGIVYVDLKTGHRTAPIMRQELWADRQLDRFHVVLSMNGRLLGDILWPEDASGGSAPMPNPAFIALWTGYRAALSNGTAKLIGRGTVLGHRVYWLNFKPTSQDQDRFEVAVDAHTYKPILYRSNEHGRNLDTRILLAKAIAYNPHDFVRKGPSLSGGRASSEGGSSTAPVSPSASPRVRAPWLTAGKSAAGLRLRSATRLSVYTTVRGQRRSVQGFALVYGPVVNGGAGPRSTTINELPRPDDPLTWSHIPPDSIEITTGEGSDSGGTHTLWTGYLKKHGLYLTISTPKSEQALLTLARALHPGRK